MLGFVVYFIFRCPPLSCAWGCSQRCSGFGSCSEQYVEESWGAGDEVWGSQEQGMCSVFVVIWLASEVTFQDKTRWSCQAQK